ncbi:hypothetical protein LMG26854_05888 [Achromobacter aegrifaciens]|nr:hypothetical protein LMG26854_05888 [Achromobacter aegrifaciens]
MYPTVGAGGAFLNPISTSMAAPDDGPPRALQCLLSDLSGVRSSPRWCAENAGQSVPSYVVSSQVPQAMTLQEALAPIWETRRLERELSRALEETMAERAEDVMRGEDPIQSNRNLRAAQGTGGAEIERYYCNGALTDLGRQLFDRVAARQALGKALVQISEQLDGEKGGGERVFVRELLGGSGIPVELQSEYVHGGELTSLGRWLVAEYRESVGVGARPHPAREVLLTPVGDGPSADGGHLPKTLPAHSPVPLPPGSNLAWGHLPSARFVPARPALLLDINDVM